MRWLWPTDASTCLKGVFLRSATLLSFCLPEAIAPEVITTISSPWLWSRAICSTRLDITCKSRWSLPEVRRLVPNLATMRRQVIDTNLSVLAPTDNQGKAGARHSDNREG